MVELSHIPKGTYIVSVSGGVDSIVLLDLLVRQSDLRLIVAHIDHGIRTDSHVDAVFVKELARQHNLRYVSVKLQLGPDASEQKARHERYAFLQECRIKYDAAAVIMAHHQDDVLETIIINIIRGTGWRGLSSLRSHAALLRPLLHVPKTSIREYAKEQDLQWREDSTNNDPKYLRNYVRHKLLPHIHARPEVHDALLKLWHGQVQLTHEITAKLAEVKQRYTINENGQFKIERYILIMLPHRVALELLQTATYAYTGYRLQQPQAETLLLFAKTAQPHKRLTPTQDISYFVTSASFIVEPTHI